MAKKKKTLSDMVKAPRTIDIRGQLHMLAWITPQEGQTLKQLGGSGEKGPMGIPAYPGGFGGEGMGGFGGMESGGETVSADAGNIGSVDEDEDQDVAQDVARAYATPEDERSWVDKSLIDAYENQNFQEEGDRVTGVDVDPRGRVTGYTQQTTPFGTAGLLSGLLGITPEVYTGFGRPVPGLYGDDDGPTQKPAGQQDNAASEAVATELTQAQKDYYGRGIGTATSLPGSEQEIYSKIIAEGTSPIGGRFDREKGLLYLPDGRVINIKTGKEVKTMSGLDIFKPVSTVGV